MTSKPAEHNNVSMDEKWGTNRPTRLMRQSSFARTITTLEAGIDSNGEVLDILVEQYKGKGMATNLAYWAPSREFQQHSHRCCSPATFGHASLHLSPIYAGICGAVGIV